MVNSAATAPARRCATGKRDLPIDTEGLVVKARVHCAKVPERDRLRLSLESARSEIPHLSHRRLDAGYQGQGKALAKGTRSEYRARAPSSTPIPQEVAQLGKEEWTK